MSTLNTVIKAILHASSEPMSGYDIAKKISKKSGNSHQQIYRELGKIAQLPNVTVVDVPQDGKPDKKMYSISGPVPDVNFASSDFTKTVFGYSLLAQDIANGSSYFDSYVAELKAVENSFTELLEHRS